jgi:mannose-1-phosphate guanylyltransferase
MAVESLVQTAAVVLAGGLATRLRELNLTMTKPMIPVGNRPILAWITQALSTATDRVVIFAGTDDTIPAYFADWPLVHVVSGAPTGTAADALRAADAVSAVRYIIANGDTINDLDYQIVLSAIPETHTKNATIVLTRSHEVQHPQAFAVDDEDNVLRSFEDGQGGSPPHPNASWHGASMGVLVLPQPLLLELAQQTFQSIEKDLLPALVRAGRLKGYDAGSAMSFDIGTPERLAELRSNETTFVNLLSSRCGSPVTHRTVNRQT